MPQSQAITSGMRYRSLHYLLRKRFKWISRFTTSLFGRSSNIALAFFSAFAIVVTILLIASTFHKNLSTFDDIEDMRLLEEEDAAFIQRKQNESREDFRDPLQALNATDVYVSRLAWDRVYGEYIRKPIRPVLTKYKTRLMRELYARTYYTIANKYAPAMDVSCNYLNNITAQDSFHSFKCADTSHRCPDGSFKLTQAFAPKEGSSVTWNDVVIVLLVSAGREPYLEAAAETWISRLHPDATLFFARDGQEPGIPASVADRTNTVIYSYTGPTGLTSLDIKALTALKEAYDTFALRGKKYFLKIDDDSFLFGHNLIHFLNTVEHWFSGREQALYFGHPFCGHGDLEALGYATWCYAGGGAYGLSVEALQILLTQIAGGCAYFYDYIAKAPNWLPGDDKYGGRYEDVMVGRCVRQARSRTQERGTSLLACGSFFPYAPLHYYEQFGQSVEAMCKKLGGDAITIHNLEPSAIRFLDHMIFEYPIGAEQTAFYPENEKVQQMIDICHLTGKKMVCDLSRVPLL